MTFEEAYVPENEQEQELMEDLHIATRRAYRRGLSKEAIARVTAFMASATLAADEEPEPETSQSEAENDDQEEESDEEIDTCPECDTPIGDFVLSMGGLVTLFPCDHEMQWEEFEEEFPHRAEEVDRA